MNLNEMQELHITKSAVMDLPLFGKRNILLETIESIDESWHVEIWEERYYFLRAEIFVKKIERLVRNHNGTDKNCASRI